MRHLVGEIDEGPDTFEMARKAHDQRVLRVYAGGPFTMPFAPPKRSDHPVPGKVQVYLTDATVEVVVTGTTTHQFGISDPTHHCDPTPRATIKLPLDDVRDLGKLLIKAADRYDLIVNQALKMEAERKASQEQEKAMVEGLMA